MVEKQKDIYNCFIDYSKAFDTMVELIQSLDIDNADMRLLTNLYWNQTSALCIIHGHFYEGNIKHGWFQNWWNS